MVVDVKNNNKKYKLYAEYLSFAVNDASKELWITSPI